MNIKKMMYDINPYDYFDIIRKLKKENIKVYTESGKKISARNAIFELRQTLDGKYLIVAVPKGREKKTKKINGETFIFGVTCKTKKESENVKKHMKDRGFKVRIIKSKDGYKVYYHD